MIQLVLLTPDEKSKRELHVSLDLAQQLLHQTSGTEMINRAGLVTAWQNDQKTHPLILTTTDVDGWPHPTDLATAFYVLKQGSYYSREEIVKQLDKSNYQAIHGNQVGAGLYRLRGEIIEIGNQYSDQIFKLIFDDDYLEEILLVTEGKPSQPVATARLWSPPDEARWRSSLLDILPQDSLVLSFDPELDLHKYSFQTVHVNPLQQQPNWRPLKYVSEVISFKKDSSPRQRIDQIKQLQAHTKQTLFLGPNPIPLENVISENLAESFIKIPPELSLAWSLLDPVTKTAFIFSTQIIPETKQKRPKRLKADYILDIEPGDFVVHIDHGIAKYQGMVEEMIDGFHHEFLKLEYAGAKQSSKPDTLLVPVQFAEKVSKYIGSSSPRLHRLGTDSTWHSVTKRVSEDAAKTAQELLKLYSQRQASTAEPLAGDRAAIARLEAEFPHAETDDQLVAIHDVYADLAKPVPMDRLVCGDVGFGKTEVALRAAFQALSAGKQVAVLCPTTILAQQHFDTFSTRLDDFDKEVALLSRFVSTTRQKEVVAKLKSGQVDIVIGTHRLLSKDIHFQDLGLIIIDEEQKFGVQAKEKLKQLRVNVHTLTLSATPIPRTLNFAMSGLRDMSVINTPPKERKPVQNYIGPNDDQRMLKAIDAELRRGGQIYYLHNRVETIYAEKERLMEQLKPYDLDETEVAVAHGQMHEKELANTMHKFDVGKTKILVTTTIIENGIDLPNVNTLIVKNAQNFGLSQLYQIRGRIGRSERQAYAYFFYPKNIQTKQNETLEVKKRKRTSLTPAAYKRLLALKEAAGLGDGLKVAMQDLEIRGAGSILGKKQHGHVTAIGLNLYAQLLHDAIQQIRTGKAPVPIKNVQIDLPFVAEVPVALFPEASERLRVYQELTSIYDLEELDDYVNARFKGMRRPAELDNLIYQMRVKIWAQTTPVYLIDTRYTSNADDISAAVKLKTAKINFYIREALDPSVAYNVMSQIKGVDVLDDRIKFELENASDWMEDVEALMQHLAT